LVYQQQAYITSNSDIKAEALCGAMNVDTYDQATWDAIFDRCETLVLTGQILLNILQHAFLKIEEVSELKPFCVAE
jgi:hypothetical protein